LKGSGPVVPIAGFLGHPAWNPLTILVHRLISREMIIDCEGLP
jgi:hypothetical protein